MYPDPTANTNTMPDHCALGPSRRLYLGPTPSASSTAALYFDHLRVPVDVALASVLPYQIKYDPLLLALARVEYLNFYNKKDRSTIITAQEEMKYYLDTLIIRAAKNIGMVKQVESRRSVRGWGPRVPTA